MTILTKICLAASLLSCGANAKGNELGKVAVVHGTWSFMVLNIGVKDGVKAGEEREVNTVTGKFRIKITRVEETVSIAETLRGWHLYEIALGDTVSHALKK